MSTLRLVFLIGYLVASFMGLQKSGSFDTTVNSTTQPPPPTTDERSGLDPLG